MASSPCPCSSRSIGQSECGGEWSWNRPCRTCSRCDGLGGQAPRASNMCDRREGRAVRAASHPLRSLTGSSNHRTHVEESKTTCALCQKTATRRLTQVRPESVYDLGPRLHCQLAAGRELMSDNARILGLLPGRHTVHSRRPIEQSARVACETNLGRYWATRVAPHAPASTT